MGVVDMERQKLNVDKMRLLGAEVVGVKDGTGTLKEAVDYAFDYYTKNDDCFYLIGSAVGPEPYPEIVRYFQKIIGEEAKAQLKEKENRLPDAIIACVGGGSNSIGLFSDFIEDKSVDIYGIEAAGKGIGTGKHASAIANNTIGIMHGMKTYIMADKDGNIEEAYSLSAGLDYPGVGPDHAFLNASGRVKYDSINDEEALDAFRLLTKLEGIIPALESAHAVAYAVKIAKNYDKDDIILVNLSGRGDKDLDIVFNN